MTFSRRLAGPTVFCAALCAGHAAVSAGEPAPALQRLASIRRLTSTLAAELKSPDEAQRAAAWAEVALVAQAVSGRECAAVAVDGTRPADACVAASGTVARDTAAYGLLSLGYSPRETADIVAGRLTRHALDTARRMIMSGRGPAAAAEYLARHYREAPADALPRPSGDRPGRGAAFDALIASASARHGVDERLVRGVIAAESAFDPLAQSPMGALGLMQLMPATARALGADPLVPAENVDGGVRYLAWLLRTFGRTELALVAYNAGPAFARRYARQEAALYGETRAYLARVSASMAEERQSMAEER